MTHLGETALGAIKTGFNVHQIMVYPQITLKRLKRDNIASTGRIILRIAEEKVKLSFNRSQRYFKKVFIQAKTVD